MKLIKLIPLILFFSCINLITQSNDYNSLYFQGGSWIECPKIETMQLSTSSNDFTIQFWVSGSDVFASDGPALFSLIDLQDNVKLALFRDSGNQSAITTIVNSIETITTINEVDWSDPDKFYLISILFSNNGLTGYVNENIFLNIADPVMAGDAKLMIGIQANEERTILKNFWYGYIDEVRLWNTLLADSTIEFQSNHSNKLGEHYRYTNDGVEIQTYLDSLIGLWRFNLEEASTTLRDESEYGHDGIIYTLPNYTLELSEKGAP